jgi:hypothetical protein
MCLVRLVHPLGSRNVTVIHDFWIDWEFFFIEASQNCKKKRLKTVWPRFFIFT